MYTRVWGRSSYEQPKHAQGAPTVVLGIKPTVDFAFKRIFGTRENTLALVGLTNAVLAPDEQIVEVEILNPFNSQEFAEQKVIVLDIRARDEAGRWLNIEMQVDVVAGLKERLAYYACSLYTEQLTQGEKYCRLRPAISICFLGSVLFGGISTAHHRFRLADLDEGRVLTEAVEVHTVELTKYNLDEATITRASAIEQWAFFLLYAHRYESSRLRELLPGEAFARAIDAAEAIRRKTEDRIMYDQREKALRDYEWRIEGARREGIEKGIEKGREEGREQGELIGKITLLRQLLGEADTSKEELYEASIPELSSIVDQLQERLRSRGL